MFCCLLWQINFAPKKKKKNTKNYGQGRGKDQQLECCAVILRVQHALSINMFGASHNFLGGWT